MAKIVFTYLSGSIRKGDGDHRESFWGEDSIVALRNRLLPLECVILNPSIRGDDLSDFMGAFGHDLFQVLSSDVVLVDARERRGLGVGAEMYFAKTRRIPVISIVPPNSHYHRKDFNLLGQDLTEWVHPFIWGLSDALVTDIADAADAITRITTESDVEIKSAEYCDAAIRHYLETQLHRDVEMRRWIESHEQLQRQTELILNAREH